MFRTARGRELPSTYLSGGFIIFNHAEKFHLSWGTRSVWGAGCLYLLMGVFLGLSGGCLARLLVKGSYSLGCFIHAEKLKVYFPVCFGCYCKKSVKLYIFVACKRYVT